MWLNIVRIGYLGYGEIIAKGGGGHVTCNYTAYDRLRTQLSKFDHNFKGLVFPLQNE